MNPATIHIAGIPTRIEFERQTPVRAVQMIHHTETPPATFLSDWHAVLSSRTGKRWGEPRIKVRTRCHDCHPKMSNVLEISAEVESNDEMRDR